MNILLWVIFSVFMLDMWVSMLATAKTRGHNWDGDVDENEYSTWIPFDGAYKIFTFLAFGAFIAFDIQSGERWTTPLVMFFGFIFGMYVDFRTPNPIYTINRDVLWIKEGRFNPRYSITPESKLAVIRANWKRYAVDTIGSFIVLLFIAV